MEASLISDTVTSIDTNRSHGLGFANTLTRRHNFTLSSPDQQHRLEICAQSFPIDAVAPPPVKPTTIPKTRARKRSRVRRRQIIADDQGDGGGFFGSGDGPFGGGGGCGGSGGDFHGFSWDESLPSPSDPAFDFVYEVLTWFVLSNCLHFAFKRVVRIVSDGVADPGERRLR